MMAVQPHQTVSDKQTHPEEQWQLGVSEVLLQPARDIQVGVLDDIRGVDPAAQPRIQAHLDHPA